MIGFSHKTLDWNLSVGKFSRQIIIVQIFSETRTKLKTTAVVIFDAQKIYAK